MKFLDDICLSDRRRAVILPGHGKQAVLEEGSHLFSEPTLDFQSILAKIPPELEGERFILSNLATGLGFRVEKAGWIMILTDHSCPTDDWHDINWKLINRFKDKLHTVAEFDDGELLPGYASRLTLYGIYLEENFEFRTLIRPGDFAIVFADISPNYVPKSGDEMFKDSMELSMRTLIPYTGEALKNDDYYKPENRGFAGCPSIAITSEDTLYAAFFCDPFGFVFSSGENHYSYVQVVRSFDEGITWEDPLMVIDPDKEGPGRTFDLMLWSSPDRKRIYFSYAQCASNSSFIGGKLGTWLTYTDNPEDPVPTWATPIRLFDGIASGKPWFASDGNWYWATQLWESVEKQYFDLDSEEGIFGMHLYRSADGVNYEHVCYIDSDNHGLSEPTVIEAEKGNLFLIQRHWLGTRYFTSTLSDPTKWSEYNILRYDNRDDSSEHMNTCNGRNYISKLPSGRLLYLYQNTAGENVRNNISAALSCDGGITWPYKISLDSRPRSSYPIADINSKGEIYIVYDQGRLILSRDDSSIAELLYARITEEDIMAGEIVRDHSVTKRLLSRYGMPPKEDTQAEQLGRVTEEMLNKSPELRAAFEKAKAERSLENYQNLCREYDKLTK